MAPTPARLPCRPPEAVRWLGVEVAILHRKLASPALRSSIPQPTRYLSCQNPRSFRDRPSINAFTQSTCLPAMRSSPALPRLPPPIPAPETEAQPRPSSPAKKISAPAWLLSTESCISHGHPTRTPPLGMAGSLATQRTTPPRQAVSDRENGGRGRR